jgi:predicted membrane channel-forming protein YqfA (hemolysin III family)
MPNAYVVASSAFFFVPALLSLFRQCIFVSVVLINAALFSTLYHVSNEKNYEDLDVFWASLAVFVALLLLAVLALDYAPWNWRIVMPLLFGVTAFVLYFTDGQCQGDPCVPTQKYDLYHSLWHLFIGIAGIFLVWTPVDLSRAVRTTYADLGHHLIKNSK